MWKTIKYLLIFVACQIIAAIPAIIVALIWHLDKGTATILAIGVGNLLAGIFLYLKMGLSLKADFSVSGYGKIIALCTLTTLFMLLPEGAVVSALELPDKMEDLDDDMSSYLGIFIVGIIAPVVEEILFRGAVLRSLLSWEKLGNRRCAAVVLSALLFSLVHLNPAQIPGTFVAGLLFGWITVETGSLAPAIVMHVVNNTCACALDRMDIPDDYVLFGSQALENGAIALSTVLFILCLSALYRRFQYNKERSGKFQYLAQSKHKHNDAE